MIVIKDLTISELPGFVESEEFRLMKNIPVTRHRALSHLNNPNAASEDKILFLAYEDEKFLGYLGTLPDELTMGVKRIKIAWLSCMWTDQLARGKGIASLLLHHAHKTWDGNLLITNFIPHSKKIFLKTGLFTEFKSLPGIRGYLRFNLKEILIAKKPFLSKFSLLISFTDWFFNLFNEVRLLKWDNKKLLSQIRFEYINDLDRETAEFIKSKNINHITPKSDSFFNWFVRYPWVLNSPVNDLNKSRYIFSSSLKNFNQLLIKVFDSNNRLIAFMVLTSRGTHLKTPFLYFDKKDTVSVINVIYAHALKFGTATFDTFHPLLAGFISGSRNPFLLTRKMNHEFLINKVLPGKIGNTDDLCFLDGDGDTGFV